MKAVFRVWFAYFGIVWLQEWLGILGALLLGAALLIAVLAKIPNAIPATAGFGFTGMALLVFVPAFMGGAALRWGSSRSMLFLRPNGRLRMLAGATLHITTLAALITLPLLLVSLLYAHAGTAPRSPLIPPGHLFALCWSATALMWIAIFAITSNPALSFLAMFLPLILVKTARYLSVEMPEPLPALGFGIAAWGAFALWYMKAGTIRPPRWYGDRASGSYETTPLAQALAWLDWSSGPRTRQRALNQLLLGMSSPLRNGATMAVWIVLMLAFMSLVNSKSPIMFGLPAFPLTMAAMLGGTMAFMATRRSRMLWLRAGIDRAGLFTATERNGLASSLLTMAILTGVTAAIALIRQPGLTPEFVMFAATQFVVCTCAFYGGMAMTHGWNAEDVLLCIVLGALFMVGMIITRPTPGNSLNTLAIVMAINGVATVLLRFYARRNWLRLDWRVAKMPAKMRR